MARIYAFLLVISTAIFISTAVKISGVLKFPQGGRNYSYIPPTSCIHLEISEDIQCFAAPCNLPVLFKETIAHDDIVIENFEMKYEVEADLQNGHPYRGGIVMNIVQCNANGQFEVGDYINEYHFGFTYREEDGDVTDFNMEFNSVTPNVDFFLNPYIHNIRTTVKPTTESTTLTTSTTTTTTTTTVDTTPTDRSTRKPTVPMTTTPTIPSNKVLFEGTVSLPAQGNYSYVPAKASLWIELKLIYCYMRECKIPDHTDILKLPIQQFSGEYGNEIKFELYVDNRNFEEYGISAFVHWGHSPEDANNLRAGDYFLSQRNHFAYSGESLIRIDMQLTNYEKYQCGMEQCFDKERCIYNSYNMKSQCECPPYACGDLIEPEYVCSNTGQTFSSECWLQASDCFSGTVFTVKKGECQKKGGHESWLHEAENLALIIAFVVILAILVISIPCYCIYFKKQKKVTREHPYSTIDSIKKTKLTFGVPDEMYVNEKVVVDDKHAPENIYVTAPVRCMAPPGNREVNKDAVYLEKVDYIKFGYPEDEA